jgi:three-Cys-motif partner protein
MARNKSLKFDEIGYWSEIKLEIINEYAKAYTKILSKGELKYYYIDGFAGAGIHVSKTQKKFISGSPLIALNVNPQFHRYYFIDLDGDKISNLSDLSQNHPNACIFHGDCNEILLNQVFPNVKYEQYKRALCLLDPYGLDLNWEVILVAGQSKAIEIFLNFPVMDMNRNVLWNNPDKVTPSQVTRMNAFWGDDSWRSIAYKKSPDLFGGIIEDREPAKKVVDAFRERLQKVAGFQFVPDPIPMRNEKGAIIYYLFFASPNKIGDKIARDIFKKHKDKGMV